MNRIYLKGRVVDNAKLINGDDTILKFTLAIKERFDTDLNKHLYRLIPCIIFKPSEEIKKSLLKTEKGLQIECEGIKSTYRKTKGFLAKKEEVFLIDTDSLIIGKNRKVFK